MTQRTSIIFPDIRAMIESPDKVRRMKEYFQDMHPHDIFILTEDLRNEEIAECVKALGIPTGIQVFEEFEDERKKEIFECFDREWMADVLEEMAPDERADFVKLLPEERIEEILPLVARAERMDIKKLINYKEDTAGSILTTDYASLSPDLTVQEAIAKLKQQAFDRETIYYIYVTDSERALLGFVSLRDLILAPSTKRIEDIMHKNVISAHLNEDKEVVAKKLSDYNFLAIPIVDDHNRLSGIVTVDDVVDVVIEESTEDMYKYAAAGEYIDYMKSSTFVIARQRVFWLFCLVLVGFGSAWVLQHNAFQLEAVVTLAFFIPLLLGAGGNAGTQSSTVVIRGLATGNIKMEDVLAVMRKELMVGAMVGVVMSLLVALRALWLDHDPRLGVTVGVAMVATVMLATTLGAVLPILFKKMKLDPALMSGPFITSIVDIVSLLIYFRIALLVF